MVFDKLFGWVKKREFDPPIPFGRYSDNNKSVRQVEKWTQADLLFRQNDFRGCVAAFFDYLCDDEQGNVELETTGDITIFRVYQGSILVRGEVNNERIKAETVLVRMPQPHVPVMRRLLEMNFNLYYSRYSLADDKVYMRFDSELSSATPNKLYYGLKELATKSDKQDDLLLAEFDSLQAADSAHILEIPPDEKEVKFRYLTGWIKSTLDYIDSLDHEKFSGGISYLLLALVFRIDYLVTPEGKMLSELEKIASAYYGKDDKSGQRNPAMIAGLKKILNKSREEIFSQLFRSKYTFSIVVPQNMKQIGEAIETALENMEWYRDNNYPDVANKVMEYGFSFTQYSYSLPRPLTDLYRLFMQINYGAYFRELGFKKLYYNELENEFDEDEIRDDIDTIVNAWKEKYPLLNFNTRKLNFDTLVSFNQHFLKEITELRFE